MVILGGRYYYYCYLIGGKTEAWRVPIVGGRQLLSEFSRFSKSAWNSRTLWTVPWAGGAAGNKGGRLAWMGLWGGWLWACPWPQWEPFLSHLGIATPAVFGAPLITCTRTPPVTVAFLTLNTIYNYRVYLVPFYYLSSFLHLPEHQSRSYYIAGALHRAWHVVES